MEPKMSALQRLQEKITQLKTDYEAVKAQNVELKSQLTNLSGAQSEQEMLINNLREEAQKAQALESTVSELRRELEEKDTEIEKIIAQVESLLS
jgi:predicted RNase H-like nuclease (RuvC/YqgF family)